MIGRYKVIKELGRGGMGIVYLCFDPALHRHVAIKTIKSSLFKNSDIPETAMIINEAVASGQLFHPNIVTTLDYGESDGAPFIVMEYVDGSSLYSYLRQNKTVSIELVVKWALQILYGVNCAHKYGVIHRDIKPGNILLTRNLDVKIADFGMATIKAGRIEQEKGELQVPGTAQYIAPERLMGIDTPQGDIFSVGVTIFEALTGVPPFKGETLAELLENIATARVPSLRKLVPDIHKTLEKVIYTMLERNIKKRYQSCGEVIKALEQLLEKEKDKLQKGKSNLVRPTTAEEFETKKIRIIQDKLRDLKLTLVGTDRAALNELGLNLSEAGLSVNSIINKELRIDLLPKETSGIIILDLSKTTMEKGMEAINSLTKEKSNGYRIIYLVSRELEARLRERSHPKDKETIIESSEDLRVTSSMLLRIIRNLQNELIGNKENDINGKKIEIKSSVKVKRVKKLPKKYYKRPPPLESPVDYERYLEQLLDEALYLDAFQDAYELFLQEKDNKIVKDIYNRFLQKLMGICQTDKRKKITLKEALIEHGNDLVLSEDLENGIQFHLIAYRLEPDRDTRNLVNSVQNRIYRKTISQIGSLDFVPMINRSRLSTLNMLDLSRQQWEIIKLINGKRSIMDIIMRVEIPRYQACLMISKLRDSGVIRIIKASDKGSSDKDSFRPPSH